MRTSGAGKTKSKNFAFRFCAAVLIVAVAAFSISALAKCVLTKNIALSGAKAAKNLSGGFTCSAAVNYGGKSYEVNIERTKSGGYKMTFAKPADLKSLSFEKNGSNLKVKFGVLEAAVDVSSIPQSSLYNAVINTFEKCISSGVKAGKTGGNLTLYGNTKAGEFALDFDGGMKPKLLKIPSAGLSVQFKNFKFT